MFYFVYLFCDYLLEDIKIVFHKKYLSFQPSTRSEHIVHFIVKLLFFPGIQSIHPTSYSGEIIAMKIYLWKKCLSQFFFCYSIICIVLIFFKETTLFLTFPPQSVKVKNFCLCRLCCRIKNTRPKNPPFLYTF